MLRRLWERIWGPSRSDEMFKMILENQDRQQQLLFSAVSSLTNASGEQAKVLSEYMKLFTSPGEPQRWELDQEAENVEQLKKIGYPDNFASMTDREQAEWVLAHLDKLEI